MKEKLGKPKFGFNAAANRIVFLNQRAFDVMLQIATDLENGDEPQPLGEFEYDVAFEEFFKEKYKESPTLENVEKILTEELLLCNETHKKLKEKNEGTNALLVEGSECPACAISVLRTDKLHKSKCDAEKATDPEAAKLFARHVLSQNVESFKKIKGEN